MTEDNNGRPWPGKCAMFNRFIRSDDGAITVDWVVLTAAIVGIGTAVSASVSGGVLTLSGDVSTELEDTQVGSGSGAATVAFGAG